MTIAKVLLALAVFVAALLTFSPDARGAANGEVGRYEAAGVRVVLTDLREECREGMTRFFATTHDGPMSGCWAAVGDKILLEFGDTAMLVPKSAFRFTEI